MYGFSGSSQDIRCDRLFTCVVILISDKSIFNNMFIFFILTVIGAVAMSVEAIYAMLAPFFIVSTIFYIISVIFLMILLILETINSHHSI